MVDVSICVATFGDEHWRELGRRAVESAQAQLRFEDRVVRVHLPDGTLAEARNAALERVTTPWVIFLDADDELDPGYVEAMAAGVADVRAPIVRYVGPGRRERLWTPQVWRHERLHDRCTAECLSQGNWVVIGAMARTSLLRRVRWHDFAWSEDWATWSLCARQGASFELVQGAVYRAHVRPDSRNRGASQEEKDRVHREIAAFIESDPVAVAS